MYIGMVSLQSNLSICKGPSQLILLDPGILILVELEQSNSQAPTPHVLALYEGNYYCFTV
jgi:hypothetical protein